VCGTSTGAAVRPGDQHAVAAELRSVIEGVALAEHDEHWRHQKHMQALERNDPLAWGWEKVVPISCVRGYHDWKRPDYWDVVRCSHCGTEQEP
jgi:hypothetical protein